MAPKPRLDDGRLRCTSLVPVPGTRGKYARGCKRAATVSVDGRVLCLQHARKAAKDRAVRARRINQITGTEQD